MCNYGCRGQAARTVKVSKGPLSYDRTSYSFRTPLSLPIQKTRPCWSKAAVAGPGQLTSPWHCVLRRSHNRTEWSCKRRHGEKTSPNSIYVQAQVCVGWCDEGVGMATAAAEHSAPLMRT